MPSSEFKAVFSDTTWSDRFFAFLQVVFHLYPEDKFHHLIAESTDAKETDEDIYKLIQSKLSTIKPFLSEITYALPALKKQKREMAQQTLELLGNVNTIDGYLEIGSTGRYISQLKKEVKVTGNIYLMNDRAPDNSLGEIFERGQLSKLGAFKNLDYEPIPASFIPDENLDLVTCYIGLHHLPEELMDGFIQSILRVLKPNGKFIMREHDVPNPEMGTFVSLVHTVFNLGLNESWEFNDGEYKSFKSIDEWSQLLSKYGFSDSGKRILQQGDPSDNTLVIFTKT